MVFNLARITNTHLKAYPVCYHGQSAVDAAMSLVGQIPPEDVRMVRVETYETAFRVMANDPSRWRPENRETADHSIPFVVGTVLMTGALRPDDYATDRLTDASLRDFMQRIEVTEAQDLSDRYPKETRTRISIEGAHGEVGTAETVQPKGHVENPLSDAELEAKLEALWPTAFGAPARLALVDAVWNLDRLDRVRGLVDRLCGFDLRTS